MVDGVCVEELPVEVPPRPPSSARHKLLANYRFDAVDKHVEQLSYNLLQGSLRDLVFDLVSVTSRDHVYITRAIFRWITSQVVSRFQTPEGELEAGCPMEWLLRVQSGSLGYARLFSEMTKLAGVQSKVVQGYVKGAQYNIFDPNPAQCKGTWSAVYLKGSWRLVDCLWGSRHVLRLAEDDWTLVDGLGKCVKKSTCEEEVIHYQCNDFYFLPDPDQFIYSHFPTDGEEWQLLEEPCSLDQWKQMVYVKPMFFEAGMSLKSNHHSDITTSSSHFDVILGCPAHYAARYKGKLFSGSMTEEGPRSLDKYVLTRRKNKTLTCKVRIPREDRYRLEIFVWDKAENAFVLALMYTITATTGCYGDVTPLPGDDHQLPWGPGTELQVIGVEASSHKEELITSMSGCPEIRFKVPEDDNIKVVHEMSTFDKPPEELTNKVIHFYDRAENELVIKALLDFGEHALTVGFDSSCKQKQAKCKYLLQHEPGDAINGNEGLKETGFPQIPGGMLGETEVAEKWGVTLFPENPWITKKDNSETKIKATATKVPLQFACQMKMALTESPGGLVEAGDYVMCSNTQDGADIAVRFPHPGLYHLAIHARPSNPKTSADPFYNVFNYFIMVPGGQPCSLVLPYPQTYSNWQDSFKPPTPNVGLLPKNSKVELSVELPGAKDVCVIGSNCPDQGWSRLSKSSGDTWKGEIYTGNNETLQLCATFEEEKAGSQRSFESLLQYQVLDDNDIKNFFRKRVDECLARQFAKGHGAIPKTSIARLSAVHKKKVNSADKRERRRKAREIFESEIRQRLREAVEKGHRDPLEAAIRSFRDHNLKDTDGLMADACSLLDFLRARDSLKESMATKNLVRLRLAIRHIDHKGYEDRLAKEMPKARRLLKSLERIDQLRRDVLNMDPTTWSEVRRYSSPVATVHDVIIGALLLLGDHEGKTGKWPGCQALLCNLGPEGLNRKINRFDIDHLHAEIAARARHILYPLNFSEVCDVSLGVGTFYKWAVGMLEEHQSRHRHDDTAAPADVPRQREIFQDFDDEILPPELCSLSPAVDHTSLLAASPLAAQASSASRMRGRPETRSRSASWLASFSRFKDLRNALTQRQKAPDHHRHKNN